MTKSKAVKVKWAEEVSEDDYRAAEAFLTLITSPTNASKSIGALKAAPVEEFKASDLLRASQVELPKAGDRLCKREMKKIEKGGALSPVLLVRDAALKKVTIADGFHRICAAYRIDPDVLLRCKIS